MSIAIKAENLSKAYQLGEIGTGTISRDLERYWAKLRGKEDPFLKIGETNDRSTKGSSDIVWSLKDIDFEINQGDAVGIIGRNGAGKSTLLKVLSRVTSPTTGSVKVKGRIASLLEVGTGFHPELTGRENIFLNGAILGMRKKEIARKFDEIVDFAGVERYIDTPVKRYSSGMYVRLAFAVAAHLESEILIVDEVLAVGDAEFQKKCLGKMGDVSKGEGRTVLFVSHNMAAVDTLCNTAIFLANGSVKSSGLAKIIIQEYHMLDQGSNKKREITTLTKTAYIEEYFINEPNNFNINSRDLARFYFILHSNTKLENVEYGFIIKDHLGKNIYGANSRDLGKEYLEIEPGRYKLSFEVRLPLQEGLYEVDIAVVSNGILLDHWIAHHKFHINTKKDSVLSNEWLGILNEPLNFSYVKMD